MSTTQLAGIASVFALVAYIPGALGKFIDELSASLPGERRGRAHLTLLPPRPLNVPPDTAGEFLSGTLAAFTAFDVELTEITRFPVTDVLYIALGRGHEDAYRAHSALNRGIFAYQEPFEYRPHVTLMVPRAAADIDGSQQASARKWAEFKGSKRFLVDRLDFLRQDAAGGWERVREIYLARQNAQKTG